MASAQSSQDTWCGRGRQPQTLGSPRPRHRSESRRLSDRRRPVKTVARKRDHCPGALHEGDAFHVYSRSAAAWVDGEVVKLFQDNFVRVEYEVGEYWCRKTLHIHSEHIDISCTIGVARGLLPISSEHVPDAAGPLMQGCRDSLPTSAATYYRTDEYILQLVQHGYVALLKGDWLLKCYQGGRVLPRRQQLESEEPEALWSFEELLGVRMHVHYISISHCWFTKDHPDPHGLQLQDLGPVLQSFYRWTGDTSAIAIFWCWCSFFQEPRTGCQIEMFEQSMQHMDLWYTNLQVQVWMLTQVPLDVSNPTPYADRGWTTWERSVSQLFTRRTCDRKDLKISRVLLDFGALGSLDAVNVARLEWDEIVNRCGAAAAHSPPLVPEAFATLMRSKVFTKGKTDLHRVIRNYARNFDQVMSVVQTVYCNGKESPFGPQEMERLTLMLPSCTSLKTLILEHCNCSTAGPAFFKAVAGCSTVVKIHFTACGISDSSIEKLSLVVRRLPELRTLQLNGSDIGRGAADLLSKRLGAGWNLHAPMRWTHGSVFERIRARMEQALA